MRVSWMQARHLAKKADTKNYLRRQMTDEYAVMAREHSYRARSAFKLMEIDDKYRFLVPGSVILDVGCAPGSWSQVVVERCQLDQPSPSGYLLGVDLQPLLPINGAHLLSRSDITSPLVQEEIRSVLKCRTVDVVLSDMAPNPTGDSATDHLRLINLCRTVFRLFDSDHEVFELSTNGVFLCKVWDGAQRKDFVNELKRRFRFVRTVKPNACRDHSAELYLYCSMK